MSKTLSPNVMNILAKYMVRPKPINCKINYKNINPYKLEYEIYIRKNKAKQTPKMRQIYNYKRNPDSYCLSSKDIKDIYIYPYGHYFFVTGKDMYTFEFNKQISNREAKSFDNRVYAIL